MEISSVRTTITEVRGRNMGNNLEPFTRPEAKMTTFFQNYQFDRGGSRIPVRTSTEPLSGSGSEHG